MPYSIVQDRAQEPGEFIEELFSWQAETCTTPKIVKAINEGSASLEALRGYATDRFFPMWYSGQALAAMLPLCSEMDILLPYAENISREVGFYQTKNHAKLFLQFCEGLGLSYDDLIHRIPRAETIGAYYTFAHFLGSSIEEAIGALSLAIEGRKVRIPNVRKYHLTMSEALRKHYGLSAKDVEFFSMHEQVEDMDAKVGFELAPRFAITREQQDKMKRAFMCTTLAWQRLYDSMDMFLTPAK